jgi:hypothetical protein
MATSVETKFNKPKDLVYKSTISAIASLGYKMTYSDKESGIISFESGMSMSSFSGQSLSCTIIDLDENTTNVIIGGAMKSHGAQLQVYSWGEAEKIAKKVMSKIASNLGVSIPETQTNSKGCFIATAALGDYNNPIVKDLRFFRDNWILQKQWGSQFVKSYYHYGYKLALVIEKSIFLRKVALFTIVKPIHFISKYLINTK